jgi:hypothetical protein
VAVRGARQDAQRGRHLVIVNGNGTAYIVRLAPAE